MEEITKTVLLIILCFLFEIVSHYFWWEACLAIHKIIQSIKEQTKLERKLKK